MDETREHTVKMTRRQMQLVRDALDSVYFNLEGDRALAEKLIAAFRLHSVFGTGAASVSLIGPPTGFTGAVGFMWDGEPRHYDFQDGSALPPEYA